ncbi:MAG: GWxTD domain-containing protein, partial [Salinibacter sp.]|uniref:GWxTD domain-containing protein n=1 Tax=Salinibacter sp. TaxID=2065818 RepID=UPI0035D52A41
MPVPLPSHVPGGVRHFLALVLLCGLGLSNGPVQGQSTTDTLQEAEWSSRIREAVTAYQRQNHTRALNQLLPLFEANPLVRSKNGEGTAAYWLGRVYEDQSRPMMARRVWSVGVQKSVEEGGLDVRSADAYIRAVYRDSVKAEYTQAANVYLLLFEKGDEKPPPGAREVIRRHVAQMEFLLPDTLRRAILQGKDQNREVDTTVRSRHRLASWWRSQDPKPATAKNERLVEHLQRVNHARVHYDYEKALSGFDDRGRVYVRLGAPTVTTTIDFDSGELLDVIHRIQESAGNNLFVSVSSFPENKFWLYKHGDEPSPFLFVHNGNTYRIGEIIDLIPERYTSAMTGRTGRGGAKVDFVLEALRTAYRQLSMYHTAYGPEFNRLDQYLNKMEETRIRFEGQSGSMLYTRGNRSDNSALTQQEGSPQPLGKSPSEMARSAFVTANQQEVKIARQRKKHTP